MRFIDTNYFIRFFLKDIPSQFKEAKNLFKEGAKGKKKLITSTIVIFEIYWVFGSFYNKPKKELIEILKKVLVMDFIILPEREALRKALGVFEKKSLEFEDCYNIVYAKVNKAEEFKTFDKKLENYFKKNK